MHKAQKKVETFESTYSREAPYHEIENNLTLPERPEPRKARTFNEYENLCSSKSSRSSSSSNGSSVNNNNDSKYTQIKKSSAADRKYNNGGICEENGDCNAADGGSAKGNDVLAKGAEGNTVVEENSANTESEEEEEEEEEEGEEMVGSLMPQSLSPSKTASAPKSSAKTTSSLKAGKTTSVLKTLFGWQKRRSRYEKQN